MDQAPTADLKRQATDEPERPMPGICNNPLGEGFGSVAKKIEWGSWPVVAPLYVSAVLMVLANGDRPGWLGRMGIILFLAASVLRINAKINCKSRALSEKIDESVGAVYDAGGRATARRIAFEREHEAPLAPVRRLRRTP